jgi:hypothetical protein
MSDASTASGSSTLRPGLAFHVGELLARTGGERFELVKIVPAENENFRAYLVVRPLKLAELG